MRAKDDEATLRRKADEVRARLLDVVDELDRRRHAFTHPLKTMRARRAPIEPVWYAAGGAAAVLGFSLVASATAKSRARRKRSQRMRKYVRVDMTPPTWWEDAASRAGRALMTFALVQLGKAAMQRFGGRKKLAGTTTTVRQPAYVPRQPL